jgi:hypothetical protein
MAWEAAGRMRRRGRGLPPTEPVQAVRCLRKGGGPQGIRIRPMVAQLLFELSFLGGNTRLLNSLPSPQPETDF